MNYAVIFGRRNNFSMGGQLLGFLPCHVFAEYVKVCSLYGAGFYYIPGTDICMKIGGYVRFQAYWSAGQQPGFGPWGGAGQVQDGRQAGSTNKYVHRTRAIATFDTRQQTPYGTLRTYLLMGYTHENGSNAVAGVGQAASLYATRGFIQIAGFTFGKATSFYDFYNGAAVGYVVTPGSSTGDGGQIVAAYTAQFGNGVSASIAAEDARSLPVANMSIANQHVVGANYGIQNGSTLAPDVVGSVRIDQAWGSAQIMAAYHRVSGSYYGSSATGASVNGGPDDKAGFAVGAGLRLNAPMIGPGDFFQAEVSYTEGAGKYIVNTPPGAGSLGKFDGNELGVGFWSDGVYSGLTAATGTDIQLTTAWGLNASYEHFWTPTLRTSVYGGIIDFSHNGAAKTAICANGSGGAGTLSGVSNCDPDFSFWWIGSRTQWTVSKGLYIGVDNMYQKLETAHDGGTGTFTAATGLGKPTGLYTIGNQDNWITSWRIHRDIVP